MLDELNDLHGLGGELRFSFGEGEQIRAMIANDQATAEVYLHGAHVTAFEPNGTRPVLWVSDLAEFRNGKAIRGGIPVCWPWFSGHPSDANKPAHGFVRDRNWSVKQTAHLDDGRTRMVLHLQSDEATMALWSHAFQLELEILVGKQLQLNLTARNPSDQPMVAGGALHTYFDVSSIDQVTVDGLDNTKYLDQLDGVVKPQAGPIGFDREVDRVYLGEPGPMKIIDTGLDGNAVVTSHGSASTVVWNAWIDKSQRLGDYPNDGYKSMICVETANAFDDSRTIEPGQSHTFSQTIALT